MLPARRRLSSQPQFTPRQLFAAMKGAWLEPPTGAQLGPELVTKRRAVRIMDSPPPNDYLTGAWIAVLAAAALAELAMATLKF